MQVSTFFTRIICALVLITFMIIPFFPITSSICLYVVIFRPNWFKNLVDTIYADKNN